MEPMELARISKSLAVDTRIRLLRLLKDQCLCVGALARRLGITPGAVSQHMRVLRACDLVIPEKRGYFVHYQVNQPRLDEWLSAMREALGPLADSEFDRPVFPISLKQEGE